MKNRTRLDLLLLSVGSCFLLNSCKTQALNPDEKIMYIASKKVSCTGVALMECLQVKFGENEDWSYLYTPIEGFEFVEGNEYKIQVKKEQLTSVPADASSIKYKLIKVLNTKKMDLN